MASSQRHRSPGRYFDSASSSFLEPLTCIRPIDVIRFLMVFSCRFIRHDDARSDIIVCSSVFYSMLAGIREHGQAELTCFRAFMVISCRLALRYNKGIFYAQ